MSTTPQRPNQRRWRRALACLLVALVLAGVFMLYVQPGFMVRMADYVWSCF